MRRAPLLPSGGVCWRPGGAAPPLTSPRPCPRASFKTGTMGDGGHCRGGCAADEAAADAAALWPPRRLLPRRRGARWKRSAARRAGRVSPECASRGISWGSTPTRPPRGRVGGEGGRARRRCGVGVWWWGVGGAAAAGGHLPPPPRLPTHPPSDGQSGGRRPERAPARGLVANLEVGERHGGCQRSRPHPFCPDGLADAGGSVRTGCLCARGVGVCAGGGWLLGADWYPASYEKYLYLRQRSACRRRHQRWRWYRGLQIGCYGFMSDIDHLEIRSTGYNGGVLSCVFS